MKRFLLGLLLVLASVPVLGQQRVFVTTGDITLGCDKDYSIWHCNKSWKETKNKFTGDDPANLVVSEIVAAGFENNNGYPGILERPKDNISGNSAEGINLPQILVIRQGHSLYLVDHINYNGTIIIEGGAKLFFNKPSGDKGRLTMDKNSRIIVRVGGNIIATSTHDQGLASDFIKIGDSQINGQKINALPVPTTVDVTLNEPFLHCHNDFWNKPMTNEEKLAAIIACIQQLPQPVDLLSLKAIARGEEAVVDWTVANELDFSHYVVEWSTDAQHFSVAGSVMAKGTANGVQRYNFRHRPGVMGTVYYRLLAVDIDGTVEQKGGVLAVRFGAGALAVYQSQGRLQVSYNGPANSQVALIDAMGRLVAKTALQSDGLETAGLKPGIYLVQISNMLEKKTERVLIR